MQLQQSAPIRKPLPLTPLVDIVFLLLMFFMLTSNFTKFGNLNLGLVRPAAPQQTTAQFPRIVVINVGANSQIRINGVLVKLENIPAVMNDFAAKGSSLALIRPARGATVQDLVTALESARSSSVQTIRVAQ
jgi:biopolymer transport protein ExbD